MGARGAIGPSYLFVSLVHLSLELVPQVFFGRNYTPVFSQKFPSCEPACYLDGSGTCIEARTDLAGPLHLPLITLSQYRLISSVFSKSNFLCCRAFHLVIWVQGQLMLRVEALRGRQLEFGVPIQDWNRASALLVSSDSLLGRFPTCAPQANLSLDWHLMKDYIRFRLLQHYLRK